MANENRIRIVLEVDRQDADRVLNDTRARVIDLGDSVEESSNNFMRFNSQATSGISILEQLMAAFAAWQVIDIATQAIEGAEGFEIALTDMVKVTERDLGTIRKEIMSMPAELGTASELMAGYYNTISAGVTDPVKALETLTVASKASKAAHVEQGVTIEALTKLMAGYQGQIKNVTEASDLLFTIEKVGQTKFQELVPVIGDLATASNMAGISANEMAGALALITQTAGSTASAATQFKAVVMGLLKPSGDLRTILNDLGFDKASDMFQEHGFIDSLKLLEQEAGKTGKSLDDLFGSSEAVLALGAGKADGFNKLADSIGAMADKAGATDKAFEKWKITFNATKVAFLNAIDKIKISIGTELLPTVNNAFSQINEHLTTNYELLVKVGAAADELASIIGAGLGLGSFYGAVKLATKLTTAFYWSMYSGNAAALLMRGGLATLAVSANLLFAAFAGWQIGTYLSEEFECVRKAGISFVSGVMGAFYQLAAAAKEVGVLIKHAFVSPINWIYEKFSDQPLLKIDGTFKENIAKIEAELEANIKKRDEIIDSMMEEASTNEKLSSSVDKTKVAYEAAGKALNDLGKSTNNTTSQLKTLDESQQKFLKSLQTQLYELKGDKLSLLKDEFAKLWDKIKDFPEKEAKEAKALIEELYSIKLINIAELDTTKVPVNEGGAKLNIDFSAQTQRDIEARKNAYREMYADLQDIDGGYYAIREKALIEQAKAYAKLTDNIVISAQWLTNELKKLHKKQLLQFGDFADGVAVACDDIKDEFKTAAEYGYDVFKDFTDSTHSMFSDIFQDAAKREVKEFEDYWQNFCDSLKTSFADMLADMAQQALMAEIVIPITTEVIGTLTGGDLSSLFSTDSSSYNVDATSLLSSGSSGYTLYSGESILDTLGITSSSSSTSSLIYEIDAGGNLIHNAATEASSSLWSSATAAQKFSAVLAGVTSGVSAFSKFNDGDVAGGIYSTINAALYANPSTWLAAAAMSIGDVLGLDDLISGLFGDEDPTGFHLGENKYDHQVSDRKGYQYSQERGPVMWGQNPNFSLETTPVFKNREVDEDILNTAITIANETFDSVYESVDAWSETLGGATQSFFDEALDSVDIDFSSDIYHFSEGNFEEQINNLAPNIQEDLYSRITQPVIQAASQYFDQWDEEMASRDDTDSLKKIYNSMMEVWGVYGEAFEKAAESLDIADFELSDLLSMSKEEFSALAKEAGITSDDVKLMMETVSAFQTEVETRTESWITGYKEAFAELATAGRLDFSSSYIDDYLQQTTRSIAITEIVSAAVDNAELEPAFEKLQMLIRNYIADPSEEASAAIKEQVNVINDATDDINTEVEIGVELLGIDTNDLITDITESVKTGLKNALMEGDVEDAKASMRSYLYDTTYNAVLSGLINAMVAGAGLEDSAKALGQAIADYVADPTAEKFNTILSMEEKIIANANAFIETSLPILTQFNENWDKNVNSNSSSADEKDEGDMSAYKLDGGSSGGYSSNATQETIDYLEESVKLQEGLLSYLTKDKQEEYTLLNVSDAFKDVLKAIGKNTSTTNTFRLFTEYHTLGIGEQQFDKDIISDLKTQIIKDIFSYIREEYDSGMGTVAMKWLDGLEGITIANGGNYRFNDMLDAFDQYINNFDSEDVAAKAEKIITDSINVFLDKYSELSGDIINDFSDIDISDYHAIVDWFANPENQTKVQKMLQGKTEDQIDAFNIVLEYMGEKSADLRDGLSEYLTEVDDILNGTSNFAIELRELGQDWDNRIAEMDDLGATPEQKADAAHAKDIEIQNLVDENEQAKLDIMNDILETNGYFKDFELSIRDVTNSFQDLRQTAIDLDATPEELSWIDDQESIAIQNVKDERQQSIDELRTDIIKTVGGFSNLQLSIMSTNDTFDTLKERADDLGVSTEKLNELKQEEIARIKEESQQVIDDVIYNTQSELGAFTSLDSTLKLIDDTFAAKFETLGDNDASPFEYLQLAALKGIAREQAQADIDKAKSDLATNILNTAGYFTNLEQSIMSVEAAFDGFREQANLLDYTPEQLAEIDRQEEIAIQNVKDASLQEVINFQDSLKPYQAGYSEQGDIKARLAEAFQIDPSEINQNWLDDINAFILDPANLEAINAWKEKYPEIYAAVTEDLLATNSFYDELTVATEELQNTLKYMDIDNSNLATIAQLQDKYNVADVPNFIGNFDESTSAQEWETWAKELSQTLGIVVDPVELQNDALSLLTASDNIKEAAQDIVNAVDNELQKFDLSPLEQEIASLKEQYDEQYDTLKLLSGSEADLKNIRLAEYKSIKQIISNSMLNTGSAWAQLNGVSDEYEIEVFKDKYGLSGDIEDIIRVFAAKTPDGIYQYGTDNNIDIESFMSSLVSIYSNLQSQIESEYSEAKTQYLDLLQEEITAQEEILSNAERLVDVYQNIVDSLQDYEDSLLLNDPTLTPDEKYAQALAKWNEVVQNINSSDSEISQEAMNEYADVSDDFLSASKEANVYANEYLKDQALVQAILNKTQDLAQSQLKEQQDIVDSSEIEIERLQGIIDGVNDTTTAITDLATAADAYYQAQAQYNTEFTSSFNADMTAIIDGINSMADKYADAASTPEPEPSGDTSSTESVPQTPAASENIPNMASDVSYSAVVQSTIDAIVKATDLNVDMSQADQGIYSYDRAGYTFTYDANTNTMEKIEARAGGGGVADGTYLVGEEGYEFLTIQGSGYVSNHSDTKASLKEISSKEELKDLIMEVRDLKGVIQQVGFGTKLNSSKILKILEKIDDIGVSERAA